MFDVYFQDCRLHWFACIFTSLACVAGGISRASAFLAAACFGLNHAAAKMTASFGTSDLIFINANNLPAL